MTLRWILTAGLLWGAAAPAQEAASAINLLLITADDMNADSAGWMGCKLGATPSLDAFAAGSMRFEQSHVVAPICQPSRSALMTGRVPHRNGALGFNPIRDDVPTLMETLSARGYFTACLNKVAHTAVKKGAKPWDATDDGTGKNPKRIGERLREQLQAAADRKKPFFINANLTDPHRPFPGSAQEGLGGKKNAEGLGDVTPYDPKEVTVPSFLEDLPPIRKEVAQYFTGVRRFDQGFAELLKALRESGRFDRTAILFLPDHGISMPFSKATVYRNGTWSPFLLRWPGMGEPRAFKTEMVASVDLMPTLLEILGAPAPAGIDGRSLLPLMRGEKQEGRDRVITYVNTVSSGASFPQRAVRTLGRSYLWQGWPDGRTRLRVEAFSGLTFKALEAAAGSDARIKSRVDQLVLGAPEQFFNLEEDPDERRNLIDDPRHKDEIARMRRILLEEMERTGDPQLAAFKKTFGATQEVRRRFLGTDGERSLLIYVDQPDPSKDWTVKTPGGPRDLRLVEGKRVLVSHRSGAAEYELETGKEAWKIEGFRGVQSAIRLSNGNTLLGGAGEKGIALIEADREGKEVRRIVVEGKRDNHIVHRVANGNFLMTHNAGQKSWALEADPEGKPVWEVAIPYAADDVDRLENGNTLVPTGGGCTVLEIDKEGKVVRTAGGKEAHPALRLNWTASAQVLKSGNIVATNWLGHKAGLTGPHAVEFDRANKLVWSWEDAKRVQTLHNVLVLE